MWPGERCFFRIFFALRAVSTFLAPIAPSFPSISQPSLFIKGIGYVLQSLLAVAMSSLYKGGNFGQQSSCSSGNLCECGSEKVLRTIQLLMILVC